MMLWGVINRCTTGAKLLSSPLLLERKVSKVVLSQRCMSYGLTKFQWGMPENKNSSSDEDDNFSGGAYVLLVIPVAALGLGTWQVFRWRWKLKQIEELESKTMAPAVNFPDDPSNLEDLEYQKVKVKGRFDYSKEVLLGPRSLNKEGTAPKEGIIKKVRNDSGYNLVTPFKVSGRDLTILVSRGWIPNRKETNYQTVPTDQEVEIVGVVRKNEQRPQFVSQHSGTKNLFLYRDIAGMCDALSSAPIFLDLASIEGTDLTTNYPIPGQTRASLRNEHVNYFITWFSLSLITSLMWHRLFILKKPLR